MGTINACELLKMPWLPKRKFIWHGHLCRRLLVSESTLWINSVRCSLPITVLEAPKSTTPLQPCDTNNKSTLLMDSDGITTLGSSLLKGKRFGGLFGPWLPRTRSLIPLSAVSTLKTPTKHTCKSASSSGDSSRTCGNCKNSKPSMSSVSLMALLAYIAEAPLIIDAPADVPLPTELAWFFSGHSAFQCPTLPHNLHRLDKILSCKVFRFRPPFPLANDLCFPLPLAARTGQKPRLRNFSDNLRLASW